MNRNATDELLRSPTATRPEVILGPSKQIEILRRRISAFRWKAITSAIMEYGLVAILTIGALTVTYHLWGADLSLPLDSISGDVPIAVYLAKALGEDALLHNVRVGAPIGLDYYDFLQPDFIHQGILKIIAKSTGDAVIAINIYYLLSFVLISLAAYFVFRNYSITKPTAAVCATLYSFTPSHLMRSYYHIFLSAYYLVPLVVLLALRIMKVDRKPVGSITHEPKSASSQRLPWTTLPYGTLVLAVIVGGSGVYYSFYSILFLAIAGVYAACVGKNLRNASLALICMVIIGVSTVTALLPAVRYRTEFGINSQVAARSTGETDILSLKLAHLVLPMPQHHIARLREVTARYNSGLPALNGNESQFAALGFAGVIGFLALLLWVVVGSADTAEGRLLHQLGALNIGGLLFATTGGFGVLFSLLVTPQLRSNNRLNVFIAFFSLFAMAILVERLRRRLPGTTLVQGGFWALLVLVLILGLYDQTPERSRSIPMSQAAFQQNRAFVRNIEAELPGGAAVLQLPFETFPEALPINGMGGYDHLWAYINSKKVKWSFPVMRGRPGEDWMARLSGQPVPMLIQQARSAGYRGIYIDRWGYPDSGVSFESQIRAQLGSKPLISGDARYSFYRLTNSRTIASVERPQFLIAFLSGSYGREVDSGREWHWCDRQGSLGILNLSRTKQKAKLVMQLFSGFTQPATLFLRTSDAASEVSITSAGSLLNWDLDLKPGMNRIDFSTDAPRVPTGPGDTRRIHFRIEHESVSED